MTISENLFEQAKQLIPGGVNSPVRAFNGVGGTPRFVDHAMGAYLYDVDGREYVDYVSSWGPMILGHAHPKVVSAVQQAAAKGLSFGAPTAAEIDLAQKVRHLMPSMEKVRFVSSGTEATMSAIRLARGFTRRDKLIKFEGCYHGHADSLLVKAGSGALTLGVPSSAGVPASIAEQTLTCHFNDLASVEACFARWKQQIACVIVEPVAGNMNCIPPAPGFLQGLRDLCTHYSSLLIFDEVMTGFRVALGGAQSLYNVTPDLTTLGKIIGGGMPVGAFGGRREIMEHIAPLGPVYQAGTLSGNPLAMAAGLATLELISQPGFYPQLNSYTKSLATGLTERAKQAGIALQTNHVGGMLGIFFSPHAIKYYEDAMACDADGFRRFFHAMLEEGIYLPPSAYEAMFTSAAHGPAELSKTLAAAEKSFHVVAAG